MSECREFELPARGVSRVLRLLSGTLLAASLGCSGNGQGTLDASGNGLDASDAGLDASQAGGDAQCASSTATYAASGTGQSGILVFGGSSQPVVTNSNSVPETAVFMPSSPATVGNATITSSSTCGEDTASADAGTSAAPPDVGDGGPGAPPGASDGGQGAPPSSSDGDLASFTGYNAGVLVEAGGSLALTCSSVTTTGKGANGVFAYGSGSSIVLADVTINCSGQLAHGVDATGGGSVTLTDVDITTAGSSSAALATDRGGGTITATGGTMTTSGAGSPAIYSTGDISVTDAKMSATGSETAVIEGSNSITLKNTALSANASLMSDKWGLLIYQSFSGDAQGQNGALSITGGSLTYGADSGPLFFITNTTASITLTGVNIPAVASGTLLRASVYSRWSSTEGGTVTLTADGQTLTGDLVIDAASSITATLKNGSSLKGAIDSAHTAKASNLSLADSTSTWTVTANSFLTSLSDTDGIVGTTISNIKAASGITVCVGKTTDSWPGATLYSLNGGGVLKACD